MTHERLTFKPDDILTIDNLQTLKVYFDPLRARIMNEMAHEPRTVHQVAEALGVPFTRLYYHIKMMEKHNLIRVVDVVQLAGAIEEKYYQVSARQFSIDRSLLTFDPDGKNDSLEYMLDSVFGDSHSDIRDDVAAGGVDLNAKPPESRASLARKFLFRLTDEQATSFQSELSELLSKYKSRETAGDGQYCSCLLELYRSGSPYEVYDDPSSIEID